MKTSIYPDKQQPEKSEEEKKEEQIIHDGSGGAFEGTEQVAEEQGPAPKKNEPRPY